MAGCIHARHAAEHNACAACGTRVRATARYCTNCGSPIDSVVVSPGGPTTATLPEELRALLRQILAGESRFHCAWRPKADLPAEERAALDEMQHEYERIMAGLERLRDMGLVTFTVTRGDSFETSTAFAVAQASLTVDGAKAVG